LSIHRKLLILSKRIVTTNYDNAFEIAYPSIRDYTAYKGIRHELREYSNPESSLLIKLHGTIEHGDSAVLFPSDYKKLYEEKDSEMLLFTFEKIISDNSILFIGTSMNDPQINAIFKKIEDIMKNHNQPHFILTDKHLKTDGSHDFLIPVKLNENSEIGSFIDELIELKKLHHQEKVENDEKLLNQYEKSKKQIGAMSSKSKEESIEREDVERELEKYKAIVRREALKHFVRGVEFSVLNELEKAVEEYKSSVELDSEMYEAYGNWGATLVQLAWAKTGAEKEELYLQAIDIKKDDHESYRLWGFVLARLAETKTGDERAKLHREAEKRYRIADELENKK